MPAPISTDLRIRIIEARAQEGQTYEQLAERFGVGRATVDRMLRLARETGSVEPAPHAGGPPRLVTDAERALLSELIRVRPDTTLEELCVALAARTGMEVSRSTMSRELHRLGLTRKKNRWWPGSSARPRSWPCVKPLSSRSRPATLST
jgi:transposase